MRHTMQIAGKMPLAVLLKNEVKIIKSRHLELLIYLLKCKKTTYAQLAQRFEVSTKTVERDIDSLSAMGIPIYCLRGAGGGVRLDQDYKFGTSFFTEMDIHQIIFALKIMASLGTSSQKDEIIGKLCLLAPELSVMFENDAENYLSVDLLTEKIDLPPWVCEKIDYCLDNEVLAVINSRQRVAPIGYVLKTDGLYLFCFGNGYQMIKCRDISEIELTTTSFERNFISYEEYKATLRNSRLTP